MLKLCLYVLIALLGTASARGQIAAPSPPATVTVASARLSLAAGQTAITAEVAPQLYSIGDPTNEEQLYLENINAARANPAAEGVRLATVTDPDVLSAYRAFGVNLLLMQAQFATLLPLPPYSMNALLTAAARLHSQDMFAKNYQGHTGSDGSTPTTRLQTYLAGANGYAYAENVYAYAKSVTYGHAGFEVDWGGSTATGGMQSPPGHRLNIHGKFREIGVGVVLGSNGSVGPQLVTQDFGLRYDTSPFITGVVYVDGNGNGRYDAGEGVGGVTVTVLGSNFYAVTASSGGYSVPVPGDGTYNLTFSGGFVPVMQQTATISGGINTKVDYVALSIPSATPTPTPTPTAIPTPTSLPTVLGNISTRSIAGAGDNVLIGGFIVTGTQSKKIIVRAIGPSLNFADRLLDPSLELRDSGGHVLAANDNWGDSPSRQEIVASTVAPTDAHESAIVASLVPGSYSAIVRGVNGTAGTAVVEVYDLDRTVDAKLANVSTRALVQLDDHVLIGGFIVLGQSTQKVIVRAIGPSLPVDGALPDPTLELRDGSGNLVMANDNWRTAQEAEIVATTIPPTNDKESAIVATLTPGAYSAVVRGKGNTSGIAVVEVYALP